MIRPDHLMHYVIEPTLKALDLDSMSARNLLLGTYLAESTVGSDTCLHQLGAGPAIGIYQMEPATFDDLRDRWLPTQKGLAEKLQKLVPGSLTVSWMHGDLYLATAFCRFKYRSIPAPLPDPDDVGALANYWKKWYNTALGAGQPSVFAARLAPYV